MSYSDSHGVFVAGLQFFAIPIVQIATAIGIVASMIGAVVGLVAGGTVTIMCAGTILGGIIKLLCGNIGNIGSASMTIGIICSLAGAIIVTITTAGGIFLALNKKSDITKNHHRSITVADRHKLIIQGIDAGFSAQVMFGTLPVCGIVGMIGAMTCANHDIVGIFSMIPSGILGFILGSTSGFMGGIIVSAIVTFYDEGFYSINKATSLKNVEVTVPRPLPEVEYPSISEIITEDVSEDDSEDDSADDSEDEDAALSPRIDTEIQSPTHMG